jgi:hypothetical protein
MIIYQARRSRRYEPVTNHRAVTLAARRPSCGGADSGVIGCLLATSPLARFWYLQAQRW